MCKRPVERIPDMTLMDFAPVRGSVRPYPFAVPLRAMRDRIAYEHARSRDRIDDVLAAREINCGRRSKGTAGTAHPSREPRPFKRRRFAVRVEYVARLIVEMAAGDE